MPIDAFPMTRRAACGLGLGLAVAAGAAAPALAAVPALRVVYDPRLGAAWGGAIALPADPTGVWHGQLRPHWRAGGMTIGATGLDALFMFDLLARDDRQVLVHAARVDALPGLPALLAGPARNRARVHPDMLPGGDPHGRYVWILRERSVA
jgi:hypothetical protein